MLLIGMTIPVKMMKTFFIGVNIKNNKVALEELLALRLLSGENAELYTIDGFEIADIFQKIKV